MIVAGIRITVVTQISVATVAAYINAGGLGDIIFQGITQDFGEKVVAGAVLTSLLAIAADETLRLSSGGCAPRKRRAGCLMSRLDRRAIPASSCSDAIAAHRRSPASALVAAHPLALPLGLLLTRSPRRGQRGRSPSSTSCARSRASRCW